MTPPPLPPQYLLLFCIFSFATGCCVGSFLNVVIYRLPRGISTRNPKRSFCPECRYTIPFYCNIPVLSWIVLRGRCANCRTPISARYPIVELLTGLLFTAAFLRFGGEWQTLAAFVFLSLAVAGSYIDIDHQILPHEITWGGTATGLAFSLAIPNFLVDDTRLTNLLHSLGAAALGFLIIWIIIRLGKLAFGQLKLSFPGPVRWSVEQPEGDPEPVFTLDGERELWSDLFYRKSDRLTITADSADIGGETFRDVTLVLSADRVSIRHADGTATERPLDDISAMNGTCTAVNQPREAMGLGDANWMACVGAFLGWKAVLFTILAGSVLGALISLLFIALRRRDFAARIPFGPYLAAGATLYLLAGPFLIDWYLSLRYPAEW